MRHIDYALVPKPHSGVYLLHKFWARKPENVVSAYIERYSTAGQVVLDPFAGSGVTAIEAIKLGRKAIAIDINPLAVFITDMSLRWVDVSSLRETVENWEDSVGRRILSLYETICPRCRRRAVVRFTTWHGFGRKERPRKIYFDCAACESSGYKPVDKQDRLHIDSVNKRPLGHWFPRTRLYYDGSPFLKKEHNDTVYDLFTHRNRIAIAELLHEINSIADGDLRDWMRFALSATLPQVSKMIRADGRLGGWTVHSYWIPPDRIERNVWISFKKRIGDIIRVKGRDRVKSTPNKAEGFPELESSKDFLLVYASALDILKHIPANSVDYVFTDPPYGDSIQYMELSTLFNAFLFPEKDDRPPGNLAGEIIVNPQQRKDGAYYYRMLNAAFRQVHEVLKPDKWMTVTFHNTNIDMWNAIIKSVVLAGFQLEKIVYQPPSSEETFNRTLKPYGTPIGDYYLRFKKPVKVRSFTEVSIDDPLFEKVVVESTKKIIAQRGEPTPYSLILNGIIIELEKHGVLLRGEKDIRQIMENHLGNELSLVDALDASGKVVGHLWWFRDPGLIAHLHIPLYDRIEEAVLAILRRQVIVSFDEVLQQTFMNFPNALTPSTRTVRGVLEEYANPTPDGRWQLKQLVELRFSQHGEVIGWLCDIGKKLGYEAWVGQNEQGDIYKGSPLRSLCSSLQVEGIQGERMDRIKFIDVLWFKQGRIHYSFEVENTTGITEALVRNGNIPYKNRRLLVIPEEREKFMLSKLREPLVSREFKDAGWRIIFFTKLEEFYNKVKGKRTLAERDFLSILHKKSNIDRTGQTFLF